MLIIVPIALLMCGYCASALGSCNQTSVPVRYTSFPTLYNDVLVVHPQLPECMSIENVIQCFYHHVLGDGVMVPSPPDLTDEEYLEHFVAWQRGTQFPYIDFEFASLENGITAVELSFLNSPANRISLPDIRLSTVAPGLAFNSDIPSNFDANITVLDNQGLAQTDNDVKKVTIRLLSPLQAAKVRFTFQFTEFHDFDWFFLSEVTFCTEEQVDFVPAIQFFLPPSTIVQPSADDLRNGSTELVCTVSSQGYYTWQWEKDNTVVGNGNPNYDITIGDGSRTTKLTISNLDFSDAGRYECRVTIHGFNNTSSLIRIMQFPEIITIIPDCNKTEKTTIACELHGYQSSFSPPVWLNMDGSEIATSDKYTISSSDGVNTIVLENGTTLPSVVVSLTINNLTSADEGDYTCRGVREESVTRLTAVEEIAPPTTTLPPSPSQGPGTEPCTGNGISNSGISVIAALVIILIMLLIATLSLTGIIAFQWRKIRKLSAALNRLNATNPIINNSMVSSFNFQSETNSIDIDAADYETIPETTSGTTTLARNTAYPRRNTWLLPSTTNSRGMLISNSENNGRQLQQEPSDYLVAVSLRSNSVDVDNRTENSEQLQQRRISQGTRDPAFLFVEGNRRLRKSSAPVIRAGYDHLKRTGDQQLQRQSSDTQHVQGSEHAEESPV